MLVQEDESDEEEDEDEDSEDDEFDPEVKGPATAAVGSAPTPSVGTKRRRDDDKGDDVKDLSGDYDEFEENGAAVKKKTKSAVVEE